MDLVELSRWITDALYLALLVSAPALLASFIVGGVAGVVQAATQIQDPALGFVPRLAAVAVALTAGGTWMGARLVEFTTSLWHGLPRLLQ